MWGRKTALVLIASVGVLFLDSGISLDRINSPMVVSLALAIWLIGVLAGQVLNAWQVKERSEIRVTFILSIILFVLIVAVYFNGALREWSYILAVVTAVFIGATIIQLRVNSKIN